MVPEIIICNECVKSDELKHGIKLLHKDAYLKPFLHEKECSLCNKKRKVFIGTEVHWEREPKNMISVIIRLNYSESELWKGDEFILHELMKKDKKVFNHNNITNQGNFKILIDKLKFCFLPKNENENYSKTLLNWESSLFKQITTDIETKNFWQQQPYYKMLFTEYKEVITFLLKKDEKLFRARIGVDKDTGLPFKEKHIGAPPPVINSRLIPSGRLNRQGESLLYLSKNYETCIAECKPHIKDTLSIGQFIIEKDLKIANFTKMDILSLSVFKKDLDMFVTLHNLNRNLSLPISYDNTAGYITTQYFSQLFREIGFDGVMFNSSVHINGINIVLFNSSNAKFNNESEFAIKIDEIKYKSSRIE